MKPKFDIAVIIPLEEELVEFHRFFAAVEHLSTATQYRASVDCGIPSVRMLVTLQQDMGKGSASVATSSILRDYDVNLLVCLGIAGGLSKDLHLGDICYTGEILDVYDNSKVSDAADGTEDTKWSPTYHRTPRNITHALSLSRLSPEFQSKYKNWQEDRLAFAKELSSSPHLGRNGRPEEFSAPNTKVGVIACASVTDSSTYNSRLLKLNRRILAVETESGGVFEQASPLEIPTLVIRGLSDYADPRKGQLEQQSSGVIRSIAAANAASFFRLQFENPKFLDIIRSLRADSESDEPELPFPSSIDEITTIFQAIDDDVDQKLRELSPDYRLQPKGYKLPVPRIRETDTKTRSGTTAKSEEDSALDLRSVLREGHNILLSLPRTYPDQGLPWIIADDLLDAELDSRPVLPVVIEGEKIGPPRSTLERLSPVEIAKYREDKTVYVVFIIKDPPISSKTRASFLLKEMGQWPDARFIFVRRGDQNVTQNSDFSESSNSHNYAPSNISFSELSLFVQKNFSMTGHEAGVIAYRLRQTFKQFKLSAHPSYFAGIPKATLNSLLQANRRAELIQLAVDGFLTFLVAGDPAEISLSRTTRSRFLRKLSLRSKIDKHNLSQEELISFTREFSIENDFDIDPIEFIQAFVDRGIIHFQDGRAQISLPFIESYLLALELRDNPGLAKTYFTIGPSFDILTFDIYAELGASAEIIQHVRREISAAWKNLSTRNTEVHILLSTQLNPAFLRKQDRVKKLQNRVEKAIEAVHDGSTDLDEKQNILDIVEKVEDRAAVQTRDAEAGRAINDPKADDAFDHAVWSWAVGAALLGSGAEHLNAGTKREMSGNLADLGGEIIDQWTRNSSIINYDQIKSRLTEDEFIDNILSSSSGSMSRADLLNAIDLIVDLLEFHLLSSPFRRIMNHLCEEARQKVLALSIRNSTVSSEFGEIVRAIWLTDLDAENEKKPLIELIKRLPAAGLLRNGLVNHLLARSYWSQANIRDKLSMLDVAAEVLKSSGMAVETSQLRELIKKDAAAEDLEEQP